MHFAYPPRKNSNPPPFGQRSSQIPPILRRIRKSTLVLVLLGVIGFVYLLVGLGGETPYHEHVPSGNPPVVVVTVFDNSQYSASYLESIRINREQYASRHGYEAMIVKATDYQTGKSPRSWAKIIAMRHALSKYPDATYVWFLDQNAYIMELDKTLEEQVMNPAKLESLMVKDWPIVPPDSIIRTFSHLKGEDAGLIISQDDAGLVTNSYVLKNGDWAKYFLETWMDPLYQSYNFQKAERHALEHIVQWHPTILSKLALVPQRTFASYGRNKEGNAYRDGDFVTLMVDCTITGPTSCDKLSHFYQQQLRSRYGDASAKRKI
ncbi:putative alpha-1,6-mannosyltransferase mnn11 [Fusarium torreyae]|uniref:Alpha-1,6-mannosyltransferase mnn11 n=1 Tax=Fusarium torreyae TaxID=1237075 RepID=A0A9W8SAP0_9HYPO|nr:putative alpha-1,6-mannosyltransferase mnn11 [Fusarium torreyae]